MEHDYRLSWHNINRIASDAFPAGSVHDSQITLFSVMSGAASSLLSAMEEVPIDTHRRGFLKQYLDIKVYGSEFSLLDSAVLPGGFCLSQITNFRRKFQILYSYLMGQWQKRKGNGSSSSEILQSVCLANLDFAVILPCYRINEKIMLIDLELFFEKEQRKLRIDQTQAV